MLYDQPFRSQRWACFHYVDGSSTWGKRQKVSMHERESTLLASLDACQRGHGNEDSGACHKDVPCIARHSVSA